MSAVESKIRKAQGDAAPRASFTLGVSLKMYFGYRETVEWCREIAALARKHPTVTSGAATLFILPSTPLLTEVRKLLAGTPVKYGAQDIFYEDAGAFTGAVSPRMLRELGCDYAEIGHAERRRLFRESSKVIALKLAAAVRNHLTPVLCVGEPDRGSVKAAADYAIQQIASSLRATTAGQIRLIVAYEPIWAIGAAKPAGVDHISAVCDRIQRYLDEDPRLRCSCVIYGGSAGPGLLTELGGRPAGLFLGRFAHRPENLARILDEVQSLRRRVEE